MPNNWPLETFEDWVSRHCVRATVRLVSADGDCLDLLCDLFSLHHALSIPAS